MFKIGRKARAASLDIVDEAEGLIRFQADRMSVSGTSREEYRGSRESTNFMQQIRARSYMGFERRFHRLLNRTDPQLGGQPYSGVLLAHPYSPRKYPHTSIYPLDSYTNRIHSSSLDCPNHRQRARIAVGAPLAHA